MLKPAKLKNGITVLKIPKNSADTFVIGFVVKTGSSVEEGNYPKGISYLIERLFWKGTDKHPSLSSLNQTLEGMGGEFLSNTGKELTEYYMRVPAYHQYKAISLLSEIIQHSMFSEREIENEKNILISELKAFEDVEEPDKREMTLSHLFYDHGLGTPVNGTIENIMMIKQQHIADYLAHQYVPSNCHLVLSGNFDNKQCMELIEQEWSLWNPRSLEPRFNHSFVDLATEDLPDMQFRQRGLANNHISLSFILDGGFRSSVELTEKSEDDDANTSTEIDKDQLLSEWSRLLLLNTILGKGLSSRLWSKCVEDEVLFETIGSNLELFSYTGFIHIGGVSYESTQFTFAFESILSVIDALKKTTVSINEFAKAREYLKGRLILENEDIISSTIWQVNLFIATGVDVELSELIEYIQKIDSNEIRSLSMDLFVPERMIVTTVGTAKHTIMLDKLVTKYLGSVVRV
jgi:predicted Zn-dependent peptidase